MKYRIEEGEISTESTEPKVIPSSSSSHNQSGKYHIGVYNCEYFLTHQFFKGPAGLKNNTCPLLFTSASGCRASENFDISSESQ